MTTEAKNEGGDKVEKTKAKRSEEVTFKCRFCERARPLDEMVVLTKYFPPVVLCRDCEKII